MSDQERNNLQVHEDCSTSYVFLAGDDLSVTPRSVIPAKADFTLYVRFINPQVTTDNAALQVWRATGGKPIASLPASPGVGPQVFDFDQNGFALPEGEGLEHVNSAAGMAGSVSVTAYYRRTNGQGQWSA